MKKIIVILTALIATSAFAERPLAVECSVDFINPGLLMSKLAWLGNQYDFEGLRIVDDALTEKQLTTFIQYPALTFESHASYTRQGAIASLVQKCNESDRHVAHTLITNTGKKLFITDGYQRDLNNKKVCIAYVKAHLNCSIQPSSKDELIIE